MARQRWCFQLFSLLVVMGFVGCKSTGDTQPKPVKEQLAVVGLNDSTEAGLPAASVPVGKAEVLPALSAREDALPAQPPRKYVPGSCEQRRAEDAETVDKARENIEETVCGAALWFDGLFGDQRNLDAARGASGRLETSLEQSQFYGLKFRARFNLRVELPNIQDRLSVFVGRDDDNSFIRDRQEGFGLRSESQQVENNDEFFAGLGYELPKISDRLQISFKGGVRSVVNPRAFVQSRADYLVYATEKVLVRARITPFYNTRDGLGVTPGIDYSRVLAPRLLVRVSAIGTISEESEGLDLRNAVLLYQGLGNQRGLAYEVFVRTLSDADVPLREYGIRGIYRQPILNRRLYIQGLTGYSFPKEEPEESRKGSYLVGVNLELPFGQLRDPGDLETPVVRH